METKNVDNVKKISRKYGVEVMEIGKTVRDMRYAIRDQKKEIINLKVEEMAEKWLNGLREKLGN